MSIKPADLKGLIGTEIGLSDWIEMPQERINTFADCTEDHQFIHIDEEKAKQTPFGGTIAHGFLTVSLMAKMSMGLDFQVEGVKMGVNYGFDKLRMMTPVHAGKRIRGRFVLKDAVERHPGQWLLTYGVTVEIEGGEKPALVADWLNMMFV